MEENYGTIRPLVSIACITFNHAKYLKQCLNGFVMQRTQFKYEIVIHDDASTDNTVNIIRSYCNKYPNLFVPILQSSNKYIEGKGILRPYVFPRCSGKYIAICEGDDYWTDPFKLQKQVDYMESHQDCTLCVHSANWQTDEGIFPWGCQDSFPKDYSVEELIRCGGLCRPKKSLPKND